MNKFAVVTTELQVVDLEPGQRIGIGLSGKDGWRLYVNIWIDNDGTRHVEVPEKAILKRTEGALR